MRTGSRVPSIIILYLRQMAAQKQEKTQQ